MSARFSVSDLSAFWRARMWKSDLSDFVAKAWAKIEGVISCG